MVREGFVKTFTGKEMTDPNSEVSESKMDSKEKMMNRKVEVLAKRPRLPEENSSTDEEENERENDEESSDLSTAMTKCCLEDKSVSKDDDDIVGKISNLRIADTDVDKDEGKFIEIKSSDIKTREEVAIQKKKDSEDATLTDRGPTGGVATNYYPSNPHYNQTAQKRYPINIGCPGTYAPPDFAYQQTLLNGYQAQNCIQQASFKPKRGRDEFDEQPVKYTRPGEEKINNLSDPSKTQMTSMTYSNVSTQGFCGGKVAVRSPEDDIQPLFGGTTTSGEFEISVLQDKTYLQCSDEPGKPNIPSCTFSNTQPNNFASISQNSYLDQSNVNLRTMMDSGRHGTKESRTSFSECDGGSEGYGSDAIASPYSEQQDSPGTNDQSMYSPPPSNISVDSGACTSMVPSPGSQVDICSPRSNLSGLEDTYNPKSPYTKKQGVLTPQHLPQPPYKQLTQVYPPTMAGLDCLNQSIMQESLNNEFFDADKLTDLKDVMDTIANDMIESEHNKQKKAKPNAQQVHKMATVPVPSLPQQIPLSAKPSHAQNRPIASVLPNQMNNIMPASSTPVYFVNQPRPNQTIAPAVRPINNQSKTSQPATTTTSQILVIPANPQPPVILFAAPPVKPQKKVSTYKHILPKIKPDPVPSKGSDSKQGAPVGSNKHTPPSKVAPPRGPTITPPVVPVHPAPRPRPVNQTQKANINQLNIARRLVATMKAEDLKFTDKDSDTFLHVAVCKADKYMVQALLERLMREGLQSMIDMQNNEGQTPVYLAVSANQPEMVRMFNQYEADVNRLSEGVSPNGQKERRAAIHCASCNGQEYLNTLQALLEAPDLNLNIANSDGYTALHCAILEHNKPRLVNEDVRDQMVDLKTDSKPIVEALIRAGADPNAQDMKSGKTAFMYALETRDYGLVEKLLALVDKSKIRMYFRTPAFDGTTCVKIMESRRSEFPQELYERLASVVSASKNATFQRRTVDVA